MGELPQFLQDFLRCWNGRDADGCAAFYRDDAVMIDPMLERPIRGTEAIRAYYADIWAEIADARLEGVCAAADEHGVVWLWRYTGSSDRRPWHVVGGSYLRREDELIVWDHAVWDRTLVAPAADA